jgi:hypothetical protein
VTQILSAIDSGDTKAAARLLPLVYDDLRTLAAARMAQEKQGQSLDATALVHEAYLRLALAMACQRLGRQDEARDWLAKGQTGLEETNGAIAKLTFGYAASGYLTDWLGGQILLR